MGWILNDIGGCKRVQGVRSLDYSVFEQPEFSALPWRSGTIHFNTLSKNERNFTCKPLPIQTVIRISLEIIAPDRVPDIDEAIAFRPEGHLEGLVKEWCVLGAEPDEQDYDPGKKQRAGCRCSKAPEPQGRGRETVLQPAIWPKALRDLEDRTPGKTYRERSRARTQYEVSEVGSPLGEPEPEMREQLERIADRLPPEKNQGDSNQLKRQRGAEVTRTAVKAGMSFEKPGRRRAVRASTVRYRACINPKTR